MKFPKHPRLVYNKQYPIGDERNKEYLMALAGLLLANAKRAARPYAEKHSLGKTAAEISEAVGKIVKITKDEIYSLLVKTNGVCPGTGRPISFLPLAYLIAPIQAVKEKLITDEQRAMKPSLDRIKSSVKEYTLENCQVVSMEYNQAKNDRDEDSMKPNSHHIVNAAMKISDIVTMIFEKGGVVALKEAVDVGLIVITK